MDMYFAVILGVLLFEVSYLVTVSTKKMLKNINKRTVIIDTSVLIDGRITSIINAGFLFGDLLIPRCVISELQYMADNADSEKRSRARHGLDIVTELQSIDDVNVEILRDDSFAREEVDDQLLKLAKKYGSLVCTIDYNLNKVAQVEDIQVLNINDLAMNLRMSYLPGERSVIELIGKGQEAHQAVGHLSDGTMVVIEHASSKIGQFVEVEFIRSLQTSAGKMMFAKLVNNQKSSDSAKKPYSNGNQNKTIAAPITKYKPVVNKKRKYYKKNDSEQNFVDLANK